MKKNEATKVEEEKKLVWKFRELPTAEAVSSLVETEVITPQEARQILFKEETKKSDEVEALQEMVRTLSEMVKDLMSRSQSNVTLVPYTKVVTVPRRYESYWMNAVGNGGISMSSTPGTSGSTTYTLSA